VLLGSNKTRNEIASILSVDTSVLIREIKRNCDFRSKIYRANLAQSKYEDRLKYKSTKHIKFNEALKTKVIHLIKDDYSPE
jgi:IS30 family transposase